MPHPDFPTAIDSTMRAAFVACPRKWYWEFLRHKMPATPSVHLHAGAAFARALEIARHAFYGEGKDAQTSLGLAAKALILAYGEFDPGTHVKTCEGMLGALAHYFEAFPLESDPLKPWTLTSGKPAVEFSFALPIPGTRHPQTGDPLLYTGRFDMLASLEGVPFVLDDKTTSQLGFTWSKQWDLRGQLTGYVWAAQAFGYPVAGAVVRGLCIKKTGYDHAQAITYRESWKIDAWLRSLQHDIFRMVSYWEDQQRENPGGFEWYPQAFDSA